MAALFPPGVIVADLREPGDPALLLPEEAEHVQRAVEKRVREFAAGRVCARRALAELGVLAFAVKVGPGRQPLWPEGVVGSITHTAGYCAAAVALRQALRGLGLDSEIQGHVREELWPSICTAAETDWLRALAPAGQAVAAAAIFAAKEAFYKCQYPETREFLGFHDARIEFPGWRAGEANDGEFEFRVVPTRSIAYEKRVSFPLRGRCRGHERFVTAAIAVNV